MSEEAVRRAHGGEIPSGIPAPIEETDVLREVAKLYGVADIQEAVQRVLNDYTLDGSGEPLEKLVTRARENAEAYR